MPRYIAKPTLCAILEGSSAQALRMMRESDGKRFVLRLKHPQMLVEVADWMRLPADATAKDMQGGSVPLWGLPRPLPAVVTATIDMVAGP